MPNTPTNHEITCSFCGKPAGDARRIIAGDILPGAQLRVSVQNGELAVEA